MPGAQDAVDGDPLGGVRALAQRIKTAVREATGLSCSIGVTPNKLLSKISSDLDKPDGLTVLMHADGRVQASAALLRQLQPAPGQTASR